MLLVVISVLRYFCTFRSLAAAVAAVDFILVLIPGCLQLHHPKKSILIWKLYPLSYYTCELQLSKLTLNLICTKKDFIFSTIDACAAHIETKSHDATGGEDFAAAKPAQSRWPPAKEHIGLLDGTFEWKTHKNNHPV